MWMVALYSLLVTTGLLAFVSLVVLGQAICCVLHAGLLFFTPCGSHRPWCSPTPFTGRRTASRRVTRSASRAPSAGATTLDATEREAILRALHESNWVRGRPYEAATCLGFKAHHAPIADTEAGHRSVPVSHLPTCWQAPTCRLRRSASRAGLEARASM